MNTSQKVILHTILAIFTYSCGTSYFEDYDKPFDDNVLKGYESIKEENLSTIAAQKDSILLEIMTIDDYEVDTTFISSYAYNVNKTLYTAKLRSSEYPKPITKVYYLQEQPSFYSFDPDDDINKQIAIRDSQENLYFGMFWYGITGINILLIGFAFYSSQKKKKAKREKQAAKRNSKK